MSPPAFPLILHGPLFFSCACLCPNCYPSICPCPYPLIPSVCRCPHPFPSACPCLHLFPCACPCPCPFPRA
eukprot:jgi/Mesvir1/11876/Mv26088-RA.1